jgi:hypothetical protein
MAVKNTKIDSAHMGIGTVLKRHRLTVPPNQRNYSWDEDTVVALLRDYSEAVHRGSSYFVGTIVVTKPEDVDVPEIADGQQRIATSTIVLAAIRDYFCTHDEEILASSIEHDFLFTVVRASKEKVPRIMLNVDDREYFRKRVLSRPDTDDRDVEPTLTSHRRIDDAAKKAAARVQELIAGQKPQVAVDRLNELVDFIENGAQIILVTAPDHLSAFVMFETLNDRGLETSQVDLLKNHLFRLAGDRLDEAQHKWALAMGHLETIDVPALVYMRYLNIMLYGPTLEKEVMARVKEKVTSRQRAIEFLDSFNDNAMTFVSIFSPDHQRWNGYGTAARRHLATILNDLKVEQIMPLVFAVASKFSVRETQKALKMFVCWSVRFLIAGGRGGFLDKHYSAKAYSVGKGDVTTSAQLVGAMVSEDIIPPDGAFKAVFASASVSRGYLARYYLRALELKAKDDNQPELIPNPTEEIVNLEHVLPQNPSDDWNVSDDVAIGNYRRLGNLALLQAGMNLEIGNVGFAEKKKHYRRSAFVLTTMIAKEKDWGPAQIAKRQQVLADLAVETWPIS